MNTLSEKILKRYQELQPKNGSKLTARIGYYFITEVMPYGIYTNTFIAKALWKEDAESNFNKDVIVEIGLPSLQLSSENPDSFPPEFFLSKLIHVKSQEDTTIIFKGEETPFVKNEWSVELSPVIIDKGRPSFLDLLRMNPSAMQDLIDQTPIDDSGEDGPDLFGDEAYDEV